MPSADVKELWATNEANLVAIASDVDLFADYLALMGTHVKVSGFPTADAGFCRELLGFVRETFRADRLLYASNWPVVSMYGDFAEHFARLREAFGDDGRFFCDNACACYGIDPAALD